ILFDNLTETGNGTILLGNRGDMGTAHGWAAAHSTVWQYNGTMVIQKPPTAQNYVVTTTGKFRSKPYVPGPDGSREARPGALNIPSLYEAELCDRLKN